MQSRFFLYDLSEGDHEDITEVEKGFYEITKEGKIKKDS